jgi:hypothetical protein
VGVTEPKSCHRAANRLNRNIGCRHHQDHPQGVAQIALDRPSKALQGCDMVEAVFDGPYLARPPSWIWLMKLSQPKTEAGREERGWPETVSDSLLLSCAAMRSKRGRYAHDGAGCDGWLICEGPLFHCYSRGWLKRLPSFQSQHWLAGRVTAVALASARSIGSSS